MKRIISFLVAVIMMLSIIPLGSVEATAAENSTAALSVENVSAAVDSYADVAINITENPGIVSMGLTLTFDDALTLVGAANGEAFAELNMTPPAQLKKQGSVTGSCRFAWLGSEDCIEIGTMLVLTFKVSADAEMYKDCQITISSDEGDILDSARNSIELIANPGKVTIIDYMPGDVDDSSTITMMDVLTLCQYYVDGCKYDPNGYAIDLKAESGDVDANGKVNMLDVLMICQYYVDGCKYDPDGYGVKLLPGKRTCQHDMQYFATKAVTCEEDGNNEYWYCDLCKDYFADEEGKDIISYDYTIIKTTGHNNISYDAVPATSTTEGYTAGVWCDKCETWLHGHEVIPPIAPNESNISYRHYVRKENSNGTVEIVYDQYLDTHGIDNPNPITYVEGTGVAELIEGVPINNQKVSANGYSFLGWYEKPEVMASRVYSISKEETGDKILYGVWSKDIYTITYLPDSASSILPRVEDDYYSVDKETSLSEPPQWPNLVWIGWSDENGKIVKSIPKGTTGNITLTANWMSRRSQTVPNMKYASSKPAIAIDEEQGIYAFTYEIGDIQNVPIQQVESGVDGKGFNLLKGQTYEINQTFTQKVEQSEATSVANTIANATTKSDSWSLSEDWNKSSSFSEEHSNEVSQEQSHKAAMSFSETNKYSISSGIGGSKEHIDESGKSTKTTTKNEFGVSVNAGVKADLKAGVTKGTPFKNASVEGKIGLDYKHSKETEKEEYEKHTDKTSSYWNVDEGFETSQSLSHTAEFAMSLSQSIKDTYGYSETLDFGGSSSNTVSSSNTSSDSREYASSVSYSTEEGKSYTVVETLTADADTGFYRKVLAANFKVFAVVIYDMKENAFSTMTYSLKIKDSEHLFTDYSTVSSFDDYENGVLPFEVPTFVGDYVYGLVGASEGLKIDDETGIVESYGFKDPTTGICYKKYDEYTDTYAEPCDTDVIIPRYVVVTVSNNQKKIVPITGISASAFSGSTVTSVYLSDKITKIPNGAFENCTSLKYVRGGTIDTIGENAFKGCTSLFEFVLPDTVKSLGGNAFVNVEALTVNVANPSVLDAALNSGVKDLTVDLSTMTGSIDGKKIITPETMEYFSISGGGKAYNKVSLESGANTVVLNNMTINNYADVPLKLTGANVELSFVTINASSLIMRLDAENTYITLDGNNYLISSGANAGLSKNIHFLEKEGSSATGKLRVTGNLLVYGTVNGTQRVSFDNAGYSFIYLTEEEYTNMLNSHYVYFDANGGDVDETVRTVFYGTEIGELPVPTRTGYEFVGWFTSDDLQVEADTVLSTLNDITLMAKWSAMAYDIDWKTGTGYSIKVERTSSPYAKATLGVLSVEDIIYYGDVLSVTYTASTGYSITSKGSTSVTVMGNVSPSVIYASAKVNSYTYNIVYVSSNGTSLGSATMTCPYGTTNTIVAPAKAGYDTPSSQRVFWDSTSAKTITFVYSPSAVSNSTISGAFKAASPNINYSTTMNYRNRTATSVEVQLTTTVQIQNSWNGFDHGIAYTATCGSVGSGVVQVAPYYALNKSGKASSASSGWMTIPLNTTNATTVSFGVYMYQNNLSGTDLTPHGCSNNSFTWSMNIPAY